MNTPCPHCGTQVTSSPGEEVTCPSCGNMVRTDEATRIIEPASMKLPDELESGTKIGRYEIEKVLGRGGMGTVYRAKDPVLRRPVAIKVLNADLREQENFIRRFDREAAHLAQLKHDGVVQVMDRGVEEGRPFLVMELVEGPVLRGEMAGKPMPLDRALDISRQLAEVLDYSHRRGVIHRDIKPENILIDRRSDRPMLTDFGLSKAVHSQPFESRLTMTNVMMGTLDYMAPEQRRGAAVDHRADLYALGVVMYEMITGELPVGVFKPASTLVQAPVWVDDVINKLLDKDPNGRFPTAGKLVNALENQRAESGARTIVEDSRVNDAGDRYARENEKKWDSGDEWGSDDEWETFDWSSIFIVLSVMLMIFASLPFSWMLASILILSGIKATRSRRQKWKAGKGRKPATFLYLNSGMWIALMVTSLIFKPWNARWRVLDSVFGGGFDGSVIPSATMGALNRVGLGEVAGWTVGNQFQFVLVALFGVFLLTAGIIWIVRSIRGSGDDRRTRRSAIPHDPRHLIKDPANAWLGGVLAGIANKTGWDLSVLRIVTIVGTIVTSGTLLVLYILAWIIIPTPVDSRRSGGSAAAAAGGCGCTTLIVGGVVLLALAAAFAAVFFVSEVQSREAQEHDAVMRTINVSLPNGVEITDTRVPSSTHADEAPTVPPEIRSPGIEDNE